MRRWTRLALLLAPLLGCAAPGPVARPADFPFHESQPPLMTLHWRVDRADGTVVARAGSPSSRPPTASTTPCSNSAPSTGTGAS